MPRWLANDRVDREPIALLIVEAAERFHAHEIRDDKRAS
jgi:hypothetical protein